MGALAGHPHLLRVARPEFRHPFWVRVPSTDVPTLDQIAVRREYEFEVERPPRVIVDAGANVGLASIYFSTRFPEARIIAVEPEARNLEVLARNIAPYENITAVGAALWREDARLDVVDPGLGEWAYRTRAKDARGENRDPFVQEVRGMTLATLCAEHDIDRIDILKMDIEGAEREVFADSSAWIGNVDALIVELHDWLVPGCSRSFHAGSNGFDHEWRVEIDCSGVNR